MKLTRSHQNQYLRLLNKRILIFDGAMGTNLDRLGLAASDYGGDAFLGCNDYLNLTSPRAVESVHASFLDSGVDVIETNTFRANRFTMKEFQLSEKVSEINRAGAEIAKWCADAYAESGSPRFVAGAMGPTGRLLSLPTDEDPPVSFDEIRSAFREQAAALIRGSVDLLLLETMQDILEVKAAVLGIHDAFIDTGTSLPVQAQVTVDQNGRMLTGTHISAAAAILSSLPLDIIGINCSTGPEAMGDSLSILSSVSGLPLSCLPNAGMPVNRDGRAFYPLSPGDFADIMAEYAERFGLAVLGGCCGTTPEHLRELVNKVGRQPIDRRKITPVPSLASAFTPLSMRQEPPPLIIGERMNTQGSRAFQALMREEDYDAAVGITHDQIRNGAHALDLCTALSGDDHEAARMAEMVRRISSKVAAPLVIDTTVPRVMEAALKAAPGRCLLNSIHLEGGEGKARTVLALARDFGAAVIALTIDETGMAATAEEKLRVAWRIRSLAMGDFGMPESSLVFDPLTFTLASGSKETSGSAVETLKALEMIKKEMPACFTCLGVSNISYGLKGRSRSVLNSVFLYHALKAGLDMAILNPTHVLPYSAIPEDERHAAEDLIYNRGPEALPAYLELFEGDEGEQKRETVSEFSGLSLSERIRRRIISREKAGLADDLEDYIHAEGRDAGAAALELLNEVLLPAIKEVGEMFAAGELILPFVLGSAEIMQEAVKTLEPHLAASGGSKKGLLVLATVYGDVHDIGKNLVKTILAGNGYEVLDLGKQVPAAEIARKAAEAGADAVGLSALLVSTSRQMPVVASELAQRGMDIPLLIGGAAVDAAFAERVKEGSGSPPYAGEVVYCRDAFDALEFLGQIHDKPAAGSGKIKKRAKTISGKYEKESASKYLPADIPSPPFLGAQLIKEIPLHELFNNLNRAALYRVSWGVKNASGEKWERYQAEMDEKLAGFEKELLENSWLLPSAAYGFWHCAADGDDLVIYKPGSGKERMRFTLPRQQGGQHLSLSDYFLPASSGGKDILPLQIVTMGVSAVEHVSALQERGGITDAYFAHGLAVQLTEAAAKWMHNRIRGELGIAPNQGKRYSWGYPALPDLSQHEGLLRLLPASRLGIRLTSAYQFIPEYTTAALIVHHPQARYFSI